MHRKLIGPATILAAVAMPFVFTAATPVTDGLTYEFVMTSQSKATGNKESVTMRGRGTYAGDNAKLEILEAAASSGGPQAFGGKDTYFIIKGGGKEMLLVNPKEKSYMKWDMATMFAGMSKALNAVGGLVKMQMSDIKIDAQDLGAGGTIEGYPTRHMRMVQNYTMTASVFGHKSANRTESTIDYYFAPGLRIANPFVTNSQQMAMLSQLDMFNNPDYKNQMTAASAKIPKTGVPLKTVTTTVTTDSKGKAETSVTTMQMVNFRQSNIPSSEFAIPSDYTMVEMPDLNAALASGGNGNGDDAKKAPGFNADSVTGAAKAGAKEAVQETVKDESKKAVTKKIKGLFGKHN